MNICILRKKGSKETCEGIADRLSKKHHVELLLDEDFPDDVIEKPDIAIRWNNAKTDTDARFEINTAAMVRLMNNKVETRRKLIASNIAVPKTYFSKREVLNANFPLIGRRTFHSQGRHMKIIRNERDLRRDNSSTYWCEFIPKDREFRVFVFFGYILGMCEKIPNDKADIAWNNDLGNAIFETVKRVNFPLDVSLLALRSVHVLGVDFAAVDIMSKGNDHYVLELNSGPCCSDYRQWLFGRAFKWVIRKIEQDNAKPAYLALPNRIESYREVLHPYILKKERGIA